MMSNSFKHYPGGPVGGVKAGTGRYFKRAKAKRERALGKCALLVGRHADFPFTPPVTWNVGDGKAGYNHFADAQYMRK